MPVNSIVSSTMNQNQYTAQERSIMNGNKTKIVDKIWKLIMLSLLPLPRLPALSPDDLESQAPPSSGVREPDLEKELNKTLLGLCFASAIQIAAESGINNSISLLSLGTAAIFAALFTSHFFRAKMQDASTPRCIREKMQFASRVLDKVAFFLAATTFFFAIATPCPLGIRCAIWALYIISLIANATCNFLLYSGGTLTHAPQVPVVEGAAVEAVKEKGASAAGRAGGGNGAVGSVAVEVQPKDT